MQSITQIELTRGIRRWDLVAFVINGTIGASIFALPSKIYKLVGVYSLITFLVCALLILLVVLCFAEVSSRFRETGGPYLYCTKAFGPVVGFEMGWLLYLSRLMGFAVQCNLFVSLVNHFFPGTASAPWQVGLAGIVIIFFTCINIVGIRRSVFAINVFTIAKLLPLLLFIGIGLFNISRDNFSWTKQPNYGAFTSSLFLVLYLFVGFELCVIPAGEMQQPKKNIPFACLVSIGFATFIYFMIEFVCIGTFPALANSNKPVADACNQFLGKTGGSIIVLGAMISVAGTVNAGVLGIPRLLFAMSEQHQLPKFVSSIHPKFRTPHVAIMISSVLAFLFTISTTFMSALMITTLARLIVYASTCSALLVLRHKKNVEQAAFKTPGGTVIAILALIVVGWLLSNTTWNELRTLLFMSLAGVLIHFIFKLSQRKSSNRSVAGDLMTNEKMIPTLP